MAPLLFLLTAVPALYFFIRSAQMISYALAIGDCITTTGAIATGAHEGNPVIAFVMKMVDSKWVLVRLAFALMTLYSTIVGAALTPAVLILAILTDLGMGWVVWHNWTLWQTNRKNRNV